MLIFFILADNYPKKLKIDEDSPDRSNSLVPHSRIKSEDDNDRASETSDDGQGDTSETNLPPCQISNKPTTGLGGSHTMSKTTSPPSQHSANLSSNQCQYLGGSSKSYSQSCMGSGDQVYYPHHSSINRSSSSSFLPVSSSSSLLQPVTTSLSLHPAVNPQMNPCRLSGQSSDCAIRQSSAGHLSPPSHSYGIRTSPPQHPSLPSCTYMQPSQPYPSHLTPNVHMMNMNFPGPMA